MDGHRQMLLQRRRLFSAVAQASEQAGQPLLELDPVNETILLLFQQLLFVGILQLSGLELLQ